MENDTATLNTATPLPLLTPEELEALLAAKPESEVVTITEDDGEPVDAADAMTIH